MQDGKMWKELHMGKSGLEPLLGSYKTLKFGKRKESDTHPDQRLAIGAKQIISSTLPPLEGPADIEFLRNKCGWCMPTAEQVIRSQRLTKGPPNLPLPIRPSLVYSLRTSSDSSESRRLQMLRHKHHFSSKTSDQMERERLISRITEELREYEKHKTFGGHLHPGNSSDQVIIIEPKTNSKFKHRASLLVRRKEIRTTNISKISRRATISFKSHSNLLEAKLSLQSQNDMELAKRVRSKLENSKSLERIEKLTKISRLETQRKKFGHVASDAYLSPKLDPTSENLEEDFLQL